MKKRRVKKMSSLFFLFKSAFTFRPHHIQLLTPRVVATAVRMLTISWMIHLMVSLLIFMLMPSCP